MSGLILAILASAQAAPELAPVVEVRPRLEARTWTDADPDAASWWVSERARLGLDVHEGPLGVRAVMQDVRVWGEELDTGKDFTAGGLDLHEGVATWTPNGSFSLALGRQEISIEEERLVGAVNWSQAGRSFDAVRASGTHGHLSYDVIGIVHERDDGGVTWDGNGVAAIVRAGFSDEHTTADVLLVADHDSTVSRDRLTAGLYAKSGSGPVSGRIDAYAQLGEVGDASIVAYLVGATGTFAPEAELAPKLTLGFDRLSGDPDLTDRTVSGFDTLWATNHKFYGIADVVGPSDRGLNDVAAKLSLGKKDKPGAQLELHGYSFADARDLDPWIGEEGSLIGTYPIAKGLTLQGGGALVLRGDDADAWGYVMLDAKP